eukprot:COSAG06_NODE_4116_length_4557_cov_6.756842_1_plen_210_part_00
MVCATAPVHNGGHSGRAQRWAPGGVRRHGTSGVRLWRARCTTAPVRNGGVAGTVGWGVLPPASSRTHVCTAAGAKRGWPLHWRAAENLGSARTAAESGVARAPRGAGGAALTPCCPRARQARQALDTGPWAGCFGVPRPQDLARAGRAGWQRLAARGLGERRRRPSARYVAARKPQAGQNGGRDCPQGTASDGPAALPVSSLRCVAARC